jgi:hypothetical protein
MAIGQGKRIQALKRCGAKPAATDLPLLSTLVPQG